MGHYPVPMTCLTKLAVDEAYKRQGVGKGLIVHAFQTAADTAEHVGSRCILVQPLNVELYDFYERAGFVRIEETPEPNRMYVLMKDVRTALRN
jgi:GNAT superfamily N-acetyltransferase